MSTCPFCGAETRSGDRFCLNCGNALSVPDASEAADATMLGNPHPAGGNWPAAQSANPPTPTPDSDSSAQEGGYEGSTFMAPPHSRIVENPGHLLLYSFRRQEVQQGTTYELDKPVTTLGRAPENDIVLTDEEKVISRYHATVRYSDGSYTVIDNGSSNGTSVNGQSLDKQVSRTLQDGDHVTLGDYELVYYAPNSVSSEATMIGSPLPGFATASFGDQQEELSDYAEEAVPPAMTIDDSSPSISADSQQHFSDPDHPLPEFAALLSTVTALNKQMTALQEQVYAVHDATQNHQTEATETAQQLRNGIQQIAASMDKLAAEGKQSRNTARWEELLPLLQEVMRNPRDIDNVRAFAARAGDVHVLLQQYDAFLQALAEYDNQLRSLSGESEQENP